MRKLLFIAFLLPALCFGQRFAFPSTAHLAAAEPDTTTFYVSNTGSDDNDGLTTGTAWATISKVNAATFDPGDNVLFNRGDEWREQLTIDQSGTAGNPITFSAYGTGEKPIINAADITTGWGEIAGEDVLGSDLFSGAGDCTTDFITSNVGTGWSYDAANDEYDCDGSQTALSYFGKYTVFPATGLQTIVTVFTIKNYSAGNVRVAHGNSTQPWRSGDITVHDTLTVNMPNQHFYLQADADFVGSVDDLFVYNLTTEDSNIWGTVSPNVTTTRAMVVIDDSLYTQVATLAEVVTPRTYWIKTASTPDSLFVYSTTDPDTRTAEVSKREYGIYCTQPYITVSYLDVRMAGWGGIKFEASGSSVNGQSLVDSCNIYRNRLIGVGFYNGWCHSTASNNTASYNGNNYIAWGTQGTGPGTGGVGSDFNTFSNNYSAYSIHDYIMTGQYSDGTGYQIFNSDSCVIENNISDHDQQGIYLDPYTNGGLTLTARYNKIYEANAISSSYGIGVSNSAATSIVNIYYNLLDNCGNATGDTPAIQLSSTNGGAINVYNNTVYNDGVATIKYQVRATNGTNITLKNNIFYFTETADDYYVNVWVTSTGEPTSDYNQFYKNVVWGYVYFNGTPYSTLAGWVAASSQDDNSQSGDPLFTTTGSDFSLQSGSPAINQGVDLGLTQDILGNPIVGVPDMGAYEYQGEEASLYGGDYFVAIDGDDDGAGTIEDPWATLQKVDAMVESDDIGAGDTIYVRGGEYFPSAPYEMSLTNKDGSSGSPICIFNYPGESPVFNCENISGTGWSALMLMSGCDYWHIRGLEIKNVPELEAMNLARAVDFVGCGNITLENMTADSIEGDAFVIRDCTDDITITNCDSFDNVDISWSGESADGFEISSDQSVTINMTGCRSWGNSDDGYDFFYMEGILNLDSCWAFSNTAIGDGDGNGFKLGATAEAALGVTQRLLTNCIGANNAYVGFDQNGADVRIELYNNVSMNCGYGFGFGQGSYDEVAKNNISYNSVGNSFTAGATVTNNSWNGGVTMTSDDFESLTYSQLSGARGEDNSLPVVTFMHLVSGSDLIDAGTDVGLSYLGTAPDMGAFERE